MMLPEPTPTPYQAHAFKYLQAGWPAVLPLPAGTKSPPPENTTGRDTPNPTLEQHATWMVDPRSANIALRLPATIIGLDVDDYDNKHGYRTLCQLENKLGPLPETWRTTSRDGGVAGIRLFTIPTGLQWPGTAGPDIDIIQHHHRYVVAPPSIHPKGGTYHWISPEGIPSIGVPHIDDLPELPQPWINHLTRGQTAVDRTLLPPDIAQPLFQAAHTPGTPCAYVTATANELMDALDTDTNRHDTATSTVFKLLHQGLAGHTGVADTLNGLRHQFITIVAATRGETTATREWDRLHIGAATILDPNTTPEMCYGDTCRQLLPSLDLTPSQPPTDPGQPTQTDLDTYEQTTLEHIQLSRLIEREYQQAKARDEARRRLTDEQAASRYKLPPHTPTLTQELQLTDPELQYRVNELWPEGANVTLTAVYKAGKTTTVNHILKCLADGHPLFGRWGVNHNGRTALWNYEVSDRQERIWLREADITNTDAITLLNLRGTRWPLTNPSITDATIEWLKHHNITTWIIDPLARAFVGCGDENSNQDMGIFLDTLDYIKEQAGVSNLLITAHTGRNAEQGNNRARGASRFDDWADVRWMIRKDSDEDATRYFQADGRDVDQPESEIQYDPDTRSLTVIAGQSRTVKKGQTVDQRVLSVLTDPDNRNGLSANALHKACVARYGKGHGYSLDQAYKDPKNPLQRMVNSGLIVKDGNIYRAARFDDPTL